MKFPQIATLAMLMACAGAVLAQDQAPQDATAMQAVRTTPTTPVAPAPLERAVQQAVHAVDPQKAKVIRRLLEVTGAANIDVSDISKRIPAIRAATRLPIGVGFGIRDAESAKRVAQTADAVVIGSRIIQEIENGAPEQAVARVKSFLRPIREALDQ